MSKKAVNKPRPAVKKMKHVDGTVNDTGSEISYIKVASDDIRFTNIFNNNIQDLIVKDLYFKKLKDEIRTLENEISEIRKMEDEFRGTSDFAQLAERRNLLINSLTTKRLNIYHISNLDTFFGENGHIVYQYISGPVKSEKDKLRQEVEKTFNKKQRGIFKFVKRKIKVDLDKKYREMLIEKYLYRNDPEWRKRQFKIDKTSKNKDTKDGIKDEITFCMECGVYRTLNHSEAKLVCENCGEEISVMIDAQRPSFKDPPPENRNYEYKRSGHFNLWMSDIQGKENIDIPESVMDIIYIELDKDGVDNLAEVSEDMILDYLKKHKLTKHYSHAPLIRFKLNGIKPPSFAPAIEQALQRMFGQIEKVFPEVCPVGRKNILSYGFIIRKCLELLGEYKMASKFKVLKSREKLLEADRIWKKICSALGGDKKGWVFIKSY